ncbi:ribbon-helix-helix domain-containing protein [Sinorhizobium sp. BG8]|uniref:ribbon-helix-helix domain-containing protein n=1 Tax=Sinorhizobium sp. BG8 TaxID=2613773 RepID=UPI00193E4772|nr:ribbon-helix-helix domain-containing protein [Sinorhizobium sp. BG8]QRM57314.1 aryl-sulfate sulfotransferase [Sinorhizobium sp. BG8]
MKQAPPDDTMPVELVEGPLPSVGADEAEPRFRVVVGTNGERRGIRLERIYWDGLSRMAAAGKMTTAELVQHTASQLRETGNLASLLRVVSLKWALKRLTALEDVSTLANINALVQASPSPTIALTREKKIQFFNEPFLAMLRNRMQQPTTSAAKGLSLSIDLHVEDALKALEENKGKAISTGFSISVNQQTIRGQIRLALAPTHERSMLLGFVSKT